MKYWKNITIESPELVQIEDIDKLFELEIISINIIGIENKTASNRLHNLDEPINLSINKNNHQLFLLIEEKKDTKELMNEIVNLLGLSSLPKYSEKTFIDRDWILHTKESFDEIVLMNKLRIVPPWKRKSGFHGKTVIIEPGMGFGTGSHPTTQLCLEYILNNDALGQSFLDFGSGSGILALVAKLYNFRRISGIEIDPQAIDNSINNCKLNGFKIPFYPKSEELNGRTFDIVMANMISDILIECKDEIINLANNNIILSGILNHQSKKVMGAFSDRLNLDIIGEKKGWVMLFGELKS